MSFPVTLKRTNPLQGFASGMLLAGLSWAPENANGSARLVALQVDEVDPMNIELFHESFAKAYTALVEEQPITCAQTLQQTAPVRHPDAAILDVSHFVRVHVAGSVTNPGRYSPLL